MAYNPPTYGESGEVYTDNIRNSLAYVKSAAEAAQATADNAVASIVATSQTADEAKEIALAAQGYLETPTDGRMAEHINDTASATRAALSATIESAVEPATRRTLPPLPRVEALTSPPTYTATNTSGSLVTYDTILPTSTDAFLRHGPGPLVDHGSGFYRPPYIHLGTFSASSGQVWALEFDHDGQQFDMEWTYYGSAGRFRLWVDGQPDAVQTVTAGQGVAYWLRVDFGSRGFRRVKIEMEGLVCVRGLRREKTATIWPAPRAGITGLVFSDSFAAGTTTDARFTAFPAEMGRRMGWGHTIMSGAEGTGYLKTSGTRPKLRDRVAPDCINQSPDVVVVAGGYNDVGSFTATAVGDEASLLFAAIRDGLPGADLIVVSPWWRNGTPDANVLAISAAIESAALAAGATWVDLLDPCIWTGTGKVTAPTGDGNCDLYVSSDGVHPTQKGADYIGAQIARKVTERYPWGPLA